MLHIPKSKVNSSCNVYLDKNNTSEDSVRITCRNKMTSYIKFDDLVILAENEKFILVNSSAKNIRLRLCGGGEDSLNNGTSGWGQVMSENSLADIFLNENNTIKRNCKRE